MQRIGVIGAGTMGHGIAQVCAMAGYDVVLCDANAAVLEKGLEQIRAILQKGVDRGKVTPDIRDRALNAVAAGDLAAASSGAAGSAAGASAGASAANTEPTS